MAQCMVGMCLNDFQIPTEHGNAMRAENKTSGKYSKFEKEFEES